MNGGWGVFLGGVLGVVLGCVLVIGGGVVGIYVVKIVVGMGVDVIVFDWLLFWLCYFDDVYGGIFKNVYVIVVNIMELVCEVDMIIGVVLILGVVVFKLIFCV